ncbi:MAG TPA: hypothetical protein VGF17_18430, partial [Phytomonospora sp.]
MSDPQWQQGNHPYPQHGQGPVPPQGQGAPGHPQPGPAPGYPPQGPGGWPGQAPPPYGQQPGQPYPPQQGFPPPGWNSPPGFPQGPKPNRTGLVIVSIVGAIALVGALVFAAVAFWPKGEDDTAAGGGNATAPTAATENYGVVVGSGPTKVDIWLDFGCPPCKTFHDANAETITRLAST